VHRAVRRHEDCAQLEEPEVCAPLQGQGALDHEQPGRHGLCWQSEAAREVDGEGVSATRAALPQAREPFSREVGGDLGREDEEGHVCL